MNRLFGSAPKAPKPSLTTAIGNLDDRSEKISVKIQTLTAELSATMEKMSKVRPGPGQRVLREKALKLLQRRKAYEAQRDALESQVWNMEQAQSMRDNLGGVAATVDALKTTTKELRRAYGRVDLDQIDRLRDEMADLLDVGAEIQESLARGYDVPEDVDEAELDAELDALGAELEFEREAGAGVAGRAPAFMMDEVPEFVDEVPALGEGKMQQAAG